MKNVLKKLPDNFFEPGGDHNFILSLNSDNVKETVNSFIDNAGDNALMGFLNFCVQLSGVPLRVSHPGLPINEFEMEASAIYNVLSPRLPGDPNLLNEVKSIVESIKEVTDEIDRQAKTISESVNPLGQVPNEQQEIQKKVTDIYNSLTPVVPKIMQQTLDLSEISGIVKENGKKLDTSTSTLEENFAKLHVDGLSVQTMLKDQLAAAFKTIEELTGNTRVIANDVTTVNGNLVTLGANYSTLTQQIAALDDLKIKIEKAHDGVEEYRLMLEDLLNYETATLTEISKNSAGLVHEMSGVIDHSAVLQMLSQVSSLLPAIGNLLSPYSCENKAGGRD